MSYLSTLVIFVIGNVVLISSENSGIEYPAIFPSSVAKLQRLSTDGENVNVHSLYDKSSHKVRKIFQVHSSL